MQEPGKYFDSQSRLLYIIFWKTRQEDINLDIYEKIDLHECPYCGGPGLLEEERGWCWYVMCLDCGAQTGEVGYKSDDERENAAMSVAHLWNIGKVIRSDRSE